MRVGTAVSCAVLCCLVSISGISKPGGGRLPGGVYEEIQRYEVLGPGTEIPDEEFILISAGPLTNVQIGELFALGLTVEASARGYTRVNGPLTAFAALGPESQALAWVEAVVPAKMYRTYDDGIPGAKAEPLSVEELLGSLGVDKLHEQGLMGQGVKIAVFDGGFTGELGELLPGRVQYLDVVWVGTVPYLVERYEYGEHGEACAQAIAAIAPQATYYLITVDNPIDMEAIIGFLRDGTLDLDIISMSMSWMIPTDHNDGTGFLAQQVNEIVDMGIAFFQSSGNYAAGEDAYDSFYAATFSNADRERNLAHDFDPGATDTTDRNTLAIEVAAWEGSYSPLLYVILEWDGWASRIQENPRIWTRDNIVRIQDLDLYLSYMTPDGKLQLRSSEKQQLNALSDAMIPLQPFEFLSYRLSRPGTYLVGVENVTTAYNKDYKPYERLTEFHLYVSLDGAKFTMEHNTPAGSLLNEAAGRVISVGAVGRISGEWSVMSFSSRGPTDDGRPKPEFVAPNYYWSPALGEFGEYFGGTSAAAPVAAGVAALLRGNWPLLSSAELLSSLVQSAEMLCGINEANGLCVPPGGGTNNVVGHGVLDAWKAWQDLSGK
jgi:subtilisin family serine protease